MYVNVLYADTTVIFSLNNNINITWNVIIAESVMVEAKS